MSRLTVDELRRLIAADGVALVQRSNVFHAGEANGPRLELGANEPGSPWVRLSFSLPHPAVRERRSDERTHPDQVAEIDFTQSDELILDALKAALRHVTAASAISERPSQAPSLARRGSELLAEIEAVRRDLVNPPAAAPAIARPMVVTSTTDADLVAAAHAVRAHAHAPYSRYSVGAAIRTDDGRLFAGANVENASYGLSVCAERSAVVAAVSAGARRVVAVAVVTASSPPAAPCGVCRQTLAEFGADDLAITLANDRGESVSTTLGELLPRAFRGDALT